MSNWLDEFANSKIAQRVVLANYLSHLHLKNEGRETYANVEEALQDFAQRTGLTELQKRSLRRQVFVKMAAEISFRGPSPDIKEDIKQFDNGNAPAAILPGVKPGSEKAKKLDKLRKKPFGKLTDLGPESQQNRDVEDNAQQKAPGSLDTDSVVDSPSQTIGAEFRPGLVIEAAEEDPWAALRKEKEPPQYQFRGTKPQKGRGLGVSKEKRILEQIRELQTQIVKRFMEPGGTISQPKWKPQTNVEKKLRKDLESRINELRGDLADIRYKRKLKEEAEAPKNKAAMNDIKFRVIVNNLLGAKTDEQRKAGLRKLSPEGLQDLYDRAMGELGDNIYRKPSQSFDKEYGDYVKCMVCDKHGKLWINSDNPGILPFSHLETHADVLLGEVDLTSSEAGKYHQEIVNAYIRRYPGAALQSRAHELATYMERMAEQATDKPFTQPPHVATKIEKKLNYTDGVITDMILHQFRKFGVDPDDRTLEELAQEVLGEIKGRLNEEFPDSLARPEETEKEYKLRDVGRLEEKEIPFEAFHRAFREEVGRIIEEYRGTFSDFKPVIRRQKIRHTQKSRQEIRKEWFKQLREEDIEQQLAVELGHWPKPAELAKKLHDLSLIKIGISVTGGRGCWNCGNNEPVLVENKRIAINSATCAKCGVYREVLVRVREIDWEQDYVIRDTNEADPGGPKHYIIWEDPDYVGNGPKAIGNCKFIHILGREEKEIHTRLVEPSTAPLAPGEEAKTEMPKLEVGMPIYSQQFGHGSIVYIEDNHIWVAWEDLKHQRTAKLGALRDEVISIASSDPNKSGNWKVIDVEVDKANTTVTLKMKSPTGREATRYWTNLGVLEQNVQVAVEMNPQELQKVEYGSRRMRREKILRRLGQQKEKPIRYTDITVDRYVKEAKPIVSRVDILKRKIRRARLLKRLLRGVN